MGEDERWRDSRRLETDASGTSDSGEPLELDALLRSLGHSRRRHLLHALHEKGELTLSDLAARIVSWEEDVPLEAVDEEDLERASIALYHAHVPKLESEGIVDFDRSSRTVSLGPNGPQVLDALDSIGGSRDSDHESDVEDADHD